eukprot:TRINITY_DN46496_c0_g1_i1.p1 TRINITY_DN46496_c0_g1~~TRINITY_DN46496_c0_g1_i1.p1  ORF type:complete len:224 (-),score=54.71 TRINITY_DN46496_c0_g1_i1:218-805(-)
MPGSSSDSGKFKVIIAGPCESGKSTIANVLAEASEVASEQYRPTQGVRILELETEARAASQRVFVELWDCAGDTKLQKLWPAIKKDAVGVVLVYNPEMPNQEQEIEQWYGWFPRALNMAPAQILVLHSLRRSDLSRRFPLPPKLAQAGVGTPVVVLADDLLSVRKHFSTFLESVRQSVLDKQRQEEEDVMKTQGN